jgi:hypothetical protein
MKTIQGILLCILLAAVSALVGCTILLVRAATVAVAAMPVEIECTRAALVNQVEATRRELTLQIAAARQDVLGRAERQAAAVRMDVMAEAAGFREAADRRLGDTLERADRALGTVEALRQDLKPTLESSAAMTAQVNDALPLFLDCDHNADCVFNRYVGASRGIERAASNFGKASTDISSALPQAITTWQSIGVNANGIAANVNQLTKPKWYDRLLGYGLNGVVIYRDLNPTSLIVKGVQILSSRP